MLYLIDGYNLLHAMGVLHGQGGPRVLEKARLRLLGLLHGAHAAEAPAVTVVFDARHAPPGCPDQRLYQGICVSFAQHDQEADDLIEELISHAATPHKLTVISDDHRIQEAARRRRCVVQKCGDYLDWLDRQRRRRPGPSHHPAAKPDGVSEPEAQRWLHEFGSLADAPEWKELFEPFPFDEADGADPSG